MPNPSENPGHGLPGAAREADSSPDELKAVGLTERTCPS